MLSGVKDQLAAIGFDNFKRVLSDIRNEGRFENLILSGAEVTTFEDLGKFAGWAASLGYFKKIQIQTNGRKLKDKVYLKHLIDQGINEFFISIHGLEDAHDAITGRQGAFEETMEGVKNLEAFDVNVISNTVLTGTNFQDMTGLMAFLSTERISEIHLWNYFPMERTDSKDLVVSMKDFLGLLPEIAAIVKPSGKAMVLKGFPECLSIGEPGFFDSLFPVTLLPDRFWREFGECGFGTCIFRERSGCKAGDCWGLSSAYFHKYGDERDLLSPFT